VDRDVNGPCGGGTLDSNSVHWFYTEEVEDWSGHLYGDLHRVAGGDFGHSNGHGESVAGR